MNSLVLFKLINFHTFWFTYFTMGQWMTQTWVNVTKFILFRRSQRLKNWVNRTHFILSVYSSLVRLQVSVSTVLCDPPCLVHKRRWRQRGSWKIAAPYTVNGGDTPPHKTPTIEYLYVTLQWRSFSTVSETLTIILLSGVSKGFNGFILCGWQESNK